MKVIKGLMKMVEQERIKQLSENKQLDELSKNEKNEGEEEEDLLEDYEPTKNEEKTNEEEEKMIKQKEEIFKKQKQEQMQKQREQEDQKRQEEIKKKQEFQKKEQIQKKTIGDDDIFSFTKPKDQFDLDSKFNELLSNIDSKEKKTTTPSTNSLLDIFSDLDVNKKERPKPRDDQSNGLIIFFYKS
jgi:hypothetical protein